ncbi:MAG TPA: hypothetical protein GYA10_10925 [Alphaproteobacteria bacterium]|nr:hypothetical protein [Alphaproteobacteria bacterium]
MRLSLAAAVMLAASPALAGATGWQDLGAGARARLIASDRLGSDGKTFIAIELDMPAGTKTYWRVPGETGIATELDLSNSTGVGGERIVWPYPTIDQQGGYTDFVYYGPVVIPVELDVGAERPRVEASLLLGICSDICIPAMAAFALPLDFSQPDAGQELRIAQALALAPTAWDGPGEAIRRARFDTRAQRLDVLLGSPAVDPASVIADASQSGHVFGAPQKSPEAGIVSLPLIGGDGADLDGVAVQFVFMTQDGPFEVTRRVEASTGGAS